MMLVTQWCVATSFRLPLLAKIAEAVHLQVADSILTPSTEIENVFSYNGRNLYLRTDAFGEVSQIGYRLFPIYIREKYKGIPIFDFLERYLLELDLRLDGKDAALRMDVDQVVVTKGSLQMLHQLNHQISLQVNIDEMTHKMYRLDLDMGGKVMTVVIPADNQLLFGGNLIELEQAFINGVNRMIAIDSDTHSKLGYSISKG